MPIKELNRGGGSRAAATSKMERFVIIVNGWICSSPRSASAQVLVKLIAPMPVTLLKINYLSICSQELSKIFYEIFFHCSDDVVRAIIYENIRISRYLFDSFKFDRLLTIADPLQRLAQTHLVDYPI